MPFLGSQPAETALTTGNLGDDIVTLAKLAGGTDGNIISYDASGNPVAIATGNDGQVLTSAGAGAQPAFETLSAGKVLQVVNVQSGAVATGTTTTPLDDTIPQNTEGTEFMTLAITPAATSNKLLIEVVVNYASSATNGRTIALHQDSIANAIACCHEQSAAEGDELIVMSFNHYMAAGTTSETTFKVRVGGSNSSTITFNGASGARRNGGVLASSITITEID